MKRLAIDMDGVLADVYSQFILMHKRESGKQLSLADLEGKTEAEAFPHLLKHVNSKGFFRDAPLIAGCQQQVKKLNEKYKVFIVSAAMEFPGSLTEKQLWLNEHFPFITWQQMVFCGSKEIINCDIMIDDHFKNLDFFSGETILFTQPHNKLAQAKHHKRVNSWEEINALLM
ncbi:MAG: 5'(3')-deoxyribonucleotidase [Bacteroidota bacterium]|nr:5'(3')-deoxyribonucleotidase [Bacteroidota bacterium]